MASYADVQNSDDAVDIKGSWVSIPRELKLVLEQRRRLEQVLHWQVTTLPSPLPLMTTLSPPLPLMTTLPLPLPPSPSHPLSSLLTRGN